MLVVVSRLRLFMCITISSSISSSSSSSSISIVTISSSSSSSTYVSRGPPCPSSKIELTMRLCLTANKCNEYNIKQLHHNHNHHDIS